MAFCLSIGIPEEKFWRMTPNKIRALMIAHSEINYIPRENEDADNFHA